MYAGAQSANARRFKTRSVNKPGSPQRNTRSPYTLARHGPDMTCSLHANGAAAAEAMTGTAIAHSNRNLSLLTLRFPPL